MTPKQDLFCKEFLIDLNGTKAAIRAGYSVKCAYSSAEKLLKNPVIQAKIAELRQSQAERTEVNADRVVEKLWNIANFDIRSICDFDGERWTFKPFTEWGETAFSSVSLSGVSKDGRPIIKCESKISALDSLGKHLGLYSDFNLAIAVLKTYGISVKRDGDGNWSIGTDSGD
jgi:phage terminase small subunit